MPIPRYRDADGDYEIVLFCPECAYAITKDRLTSQWKYCPMKGCAGKLETRRIDYNPNPYKPKGYG